MILIGFHNFSIVHTAKLKAWIISSTFYESKNKEKVVLTFEINEAAKFFILNQEQH